MRCGWCLLKGGRAYQGYKRFLHCSKKIHSWLAATKKPVFLYSAQERKSNNYSAIIVKKNEVGYSRAGKTNLVFWSQWRSCVIVTISLRGICGTFSLWPTIPQSQWKQNILIDSKLLFEYIGKALNNSKLSLCLCAICKTGGVLGMHCKLT